MFNSSSNCSPKWCISFLSLQHRIFTPRIYFQVAALVDHSHSEMPKHMQSTSNNTYALTCMTCFNYQKGKLELNEFNEPLLNIGLHSMSKPIVAWPVNLFRESIFFRSSAAALSTSTALLLYKIWPPKVMEEYLIPSFTVMS